MCMHVAMHYIIHVRHLFEFAFQQDNFYLTVSKMSNLSNLILGRSVIETAALIYHVHVSQEDERMRLHEGVIRDQERQRYKAEQRAKKTQQSHR